MSAIHPFHGVVAAAARPYLRGGLPAAAALPLSQAGPAARTGQRNFPTLRSPAAVAAGTAESSEGRAAVVATDWSST